MGLLKKTVLTTDGVLSSFRKALSDLDVVSAQNEETAVLRGAEANDLRLRASAIDAEASRHRDEAAKAQRVREKLSSLVEAA